MTDYDTGKRKSIAREHATDDPDYIGRDAEGADHYFSMYDRTVIVVAPDGVDTYDLSKTDAPLDVWHRFVDSQSDWDWYTPLLPVA